MIRIDIFRVCIYGKILSQGTGLLRCFLQTIADKDPPMTDLSSICEKELGHFENICDESMVDLKGVLPSEMLFLCSLTRNFKAQALIESGRARGVSTALISAFFQNDPIRLYSVENTRFSEDSLIAEKRLAQYQNLTLIYGDAFIRLPLLAKKHDSSVIFIDGPKGEKAILLAATLLRSNASIQAVFIHDTYKGSVERSLLDRHFPNHLSSDDQTFVEKFRYLDDSSWDKLAQLGDHSVAPYKQNGLPVSSYGHTVSMIPNSAGIAAQELAAYQALGKAVGCYEYSSMTHIFREIKTYLPRKSFFKMLLKR